MRKIIKIFALVITIVSVFTLSVKSLNYYDLYFEKTNDNIIKGSYEELNKNLSYETIYNVDLNKDEQDAINYAIKTNIFKGININKKDIQDKFNNECVKVRPVYREIKGEIIKDYKTWNDKKEIIIKIPINVEFIR
ncbi:hypothetical protein GCM10008904_26100 [Paraclostridium ghonii]|uniref:Uncharacterized protein n=1 Tax=Paraclostridium ghonii TaxID=29358 RepID=A0ABU0MZK4_9FIRM|nr:hypothetical protein [Paeniclostridium ghonii]MDQ0556039.1 hypothetical protein [Paeniclostridium ghonii]